MGFFTKLIAAKTAADPKASPLFRAGAAVYLAQEVADDAAAKARGNVQSRDDDSVDVTELNQLTYDLAQDRLEIAEMAKELAESKLEALEEARERAEERAEQREEEQEARDEQKQDVKQVIDLFQFIMKTKQIKLQRSDIVAAVWNDVELDRSVILKALRGVCDPDAASLVKSVRNEEYGYLSVLDCMPYVEAATSFEDFEFQIQDIDPDMFDEGVEDQLLQLAQQKFG